MTEQVGKVKKPVNAAIKTRMVLFNFDLELVASLGELSLTRARVQRYADRRGKKELEIYTNACIDEAKLDVYIEQLTKGKNETYEALESILETYNPKYKKIWLMYFIAQMSYEDIAANTFYSYNNVRKIIRKLKKDLINYGMLPREKEEEEEGEDDDYDEE